MDKLTQEILRLEQESDVLEPTPELRKQWMDEVLKYTDSFIDGMESKKAFISAYDNENPFEGVTYDDAISMNEVLSFLEKNVDTTGLNPASGGHIGYIPGGGIYPTAIGDFLAAITNRYSGVFFGGPGAVQLENSLIRWMCDVVGFPKNAHGNLCSGGSIANLIAITTARDSKKITSRKVDSSVIYVTNQTHHCVQKAIRIAGLNESILRYIPMDDRFKMDINALSTQIKSDKEAGLTPFLIVGSAGTTDTGSIDPLDEIADIAEEYNCWFHVDAAYGGFFVMVDELKPRFKGMDRADSVAIDPHKGLFLAYGLGVILIKDVKAMYDTHFYKAGYMQDAQEKYDEISPADVSPELTKHFRGLRLWVSLKLFGVTPFVKSLEEKHKLALYFNQEIEKLGFETGAEPELSVVLYRYKNTPDKNLFNKLLTEEIHKDGRVFLSSTVLHGENWMRAAILSFRTHKRTIDLCLEMIGDCVERVKNRLNQGI